MTPKEYLSLGIVFTSLSLLVANGLSDVLKVSNTDGAKAEICNGDGWLYAPWTQKSSKHETKNSRQTNQMTAYPHPVSFLCPTGKKLDLVSDLD